MTIFSEILEICRKTANKTKIVYGANMSTEMANRYLEALTENGLLMGNQKGFVTTEKGLEFLRLIMSARSLISEKYESARLKTMLAYYGGF